MYVKSTLPGENGFLFIHHFLLFAMTLKTLINKLIKLATGNYLINDFLSINKTESHGMIIIAKENTFIVFFFLIINQPFLLFLYHSLSKIILSLFKLTC